MRYRMGIGEVGSELRNMDQGLTMRIESGKVWDGDWRCELGVVKYGMKIGNVDCE